MHRFGSFIRKVKMCIRDREIHRISSCHSSVQSTGRFRLKNVFVFGARICMLNQDYLVEHQSILLLRLLQMQMFI